MGLHMNSSAKKKLTPQIVAKPMVAHVMYEKKLPRKIRW